MRLFTCTYIRGFALLLLFLGTMVIGLALFLPSLMDVNAYRREILSALQQSLNRQVNFTHGQFSMRVGPTFTFDNVTIKEPDGSGDFLVARRVSMHLALIPLLQRRIVLRDLVLDSPRIGIVRDRAGRLNVADLLVSRPGAYRLQVKTVQVKNGLIRWYDRGVGAEGLRAEARVNSLLLDGIARGHRGALELRAELPYPSGPPCRISLAGTVRLAATGKPLTDSELNLSGDIDGYDPGRFWPYHGKFIPFGPIGGRLALASSFKGTVHQFSAKGKLRLSGATVVWPTVFHHPVNPRLAQLEYQLAFGRGVIDMPLLGFSADGFRVRGSCRLTDLNTPDPRITARASSEPFVLERVRQWIPYGIIATDVSRYIEEHITGGLFRLETGLLDGRVSQIAHMEKGTNYNVLHIRGNVEKGIISYGPSVPAFTNVHAGLELVGKDFILSRATATFGSSPLRLEGRITDYPLVTPCSYLFQMEMNPQAPEVRWLAGLAEADGLEYGGNSRLLLRGSGLTSAYALSGDWDLKPATYSFPGVVRKGAGTRNFLAFSALLSPGETRLNSLSYMLPPLNVSATAHLTHGERPRLGFELQTNRFLLDESLPILTRWRSYRPRGSVEAHIRGSGDPRDFGAMEYEGTIGLNSFAFQPGEDLRPVSAMNGLLSFKGNGLETSNLTARYGNSAVSVRGRVRNFAHPEADLTLSSPELFLGDLSSRPFKPDASIRRLAASLAVREGTCTIRSLSGQYKATSFTASGRYAPGASPVADLSVTSPQLDLAELLALAQMGGEAQGNGASGGGLKLRLAADSARYGKVGLSHLNLSLSRDSGVYYIQALEAALYDGRLTAKGRVAPDVGRINRYDLNLGLERVNAEAFFQALDAPREITGTLNLQGNLTARGADLVDLKKSALGNLRLRLEKGKLRKFSVLSKVFSILNLSQLLKFQLPDMVHNGMPYNQIRASVSVRDGTVATQDLLISSDAINISIIGSADIVREELDFTIGVQPLQTVDKIINRIPVVGWLLTGKDKAMVTAYFEAKGKWDDPRVKSVSVKSLSKGAWNIFKRVFELPVRLFTDTGEVLLGQ